MSKEKIQQLLMAVGSKPTEDNTQLETTDYNWHEPHYFSSEQLVKIDDFAKTAAAEVAERFSTFCRSKFNVTIKSITQHFVDEFLRQLSNDQPKYYYLPFGAGQEHLCGLIGIPKRTAVNWATQLLGDSESEKDPDKNLSQLEESLMLDLASVLLEGFSDFFTNCDFQPAGSIVKDQWPLELKGTEELCKISFDVKKVDSDEGDSEAYFLILCSEMRPITGETAQDYVNCSAEDISKMILEHLQEMSVFITGKLASAVLTFGEIMDLQPDDILLLDKKVDQPAELVVGGRTVYYGSPAQSAGKYAVAITNTAAALENAAENINSNIKTK